MPRDSAKIYAMALMFILAPLSAAVQRQKTSKPNLNEQTLFSAEDESVDRPAALSDLAIDAIRREEKIARDELNLKALLASAIHLDGTDETDLIVMGMDGLRGAHIVPFWVLRKTNQGYEVILNTRSDGLKVVDTTSKGYRNIETHNLISGVAQTTTYRFDGSRYRRSNVTSFPSR